MFKPVPIVKKNFKTFLLTFLLECFVKVLPKRGIGLIRM